MVHDKERVMGEDVRNKTGNKIQDGIMYNRPTGSSWLNLCITRFGLNLLHRIV